VALIVQVPQWIALPAATRLFHYDGLGAKLFSPSARVRGCVRITSPNQHLSEESNLPFPENIASSGKYQQVWIAVRRSALPTGPEHPEGKINRR
jgi:hypothetical protein